LEILLEFVFEVLLQVFLEVLGEIGLHSMPKRGDAPTAPFTAAVGYALLGAAAGGVSLVFFPTSFAHGDVLRRVNLILAPVAAGLLMSAMGSWRRRRGQDLLRIDRFAYGYVFALALAIVRFQFASYPLP